MYARGLQHFYVNELAETQAGLLVIPLRWIMRDGQLTADAHGVVYNEEVSFLLALYGTSDCIN